MKIGITTFHWSDNYGAVLQAHALQTYLQQQGHSVQIIDCRCPAELSFLRRWIAKSPKACMRKWEQTRKKNLFEKFCREYLNRTPEVFRSSSEFYRISTRYDLLITGSDQVWNPRWLDQVDGFWDLYFLSFAGEKTKRIAYAASIGHGDSSTLSESWQRQIKERMVAMDAISVRENSSVALVQELCGRSDSVCAADPTLLLDRSHYEELAGQRSGRKKYVFSYMLHGLEQDAASLGRQLAEQLSVPVLKCNARYTRVHHGYELPSPTGWLRQIRDAEFVVTNSFHATVFCVIFRVPFAAVLIGGEIGSMNSRITDLLAPLGLLSRVVSPGDARTEHLFSAPIDWDAVDQTISELKASGISFLTKHLT